MYVHKRNFIQALTKGRAVWKRNGEDGPPFCRSPPLHLAPPLPFPYGMSHFDITISTFVLKIVFWYGRAGGEAVGVGEGSTTASSSVPNSTLHLFLKIVFWHGRAGGEAVGVGGGSTTASSSHHPFRAPHSTFFLKIVF